jgi:uncharacterized protein (TIGR00255 family)
MTGFARQAAQFIWGTATWEIRSVNHRYLEIGFRLPESLRILEPILRTQVQQYAKRGKLEISLKVRLAEQEGGSLQLNEALINQIIVAYQKFSQKVPQATLDFGRVLTWQGISNPEETDLTFIHNDISASFTQLLRQFQQAKQIEGQATAGFIAERLVAIELQAQSAATYVPEVLLQARTKLLSRLADAQQMLDASRLEQEMVVLAQRLDVSEELDRLQQHLKQVKELIRQDTGVGRRLDFLMQELNREANTLGSKANDIRMTQAAVEIKVLIEQMREQIQNIE